LLWRIFYDPLLCQIQENEKLFYAMNCSWTDDFSKNEGQDRLKIRQVAIAYMDDTTWIARSKKDINRIIQEANFFYQANCSQINGKKSILITINNSNSNPETVHVGPNREEVIELDRNAHTRFLGIWIGSKNHTKDTVRRIESEIASIKAALKFKQVTDKHIEYIINRVLILRIEYRVQHCALSRHICNRLTGKIRSLMKQKAGIVSTMPNSALHHKQLYNVKSIWEIQLENQITNLFNRLNNPGPAGTSTIIRLKQAQIKNWEPTNILSETLPVKIKEKNNFTITVLKMANKLGLTIQSPHWTKRFQWKGGSLSIKKALQDSDAYVKAIPSLIKNNIMYVYQLVNKDLDSILE